MKFISILFFIGFFYSAQAIIDKNIVFNEKSYYRCGLSNVCSCSDYYHMVNLFAKAYKNSNTNQEKEARISMVNSYLNSMYINCKNTKEWNSKMIQANVKVVPTLNRAHNKTMKLEKSLYETFEMYKATQATKAKKIRLIEQIKRDNAVLRKKIQEALMN